LEMLNLISPALTFLIFILFIRQNKKMTPAEALTQHAPNEHRLVRTWIEEDNSPAMPSWNWKCSCGVWGTAGDASKTSLGSENNVVDRFKDHAKGYREANSDIWKEKFDALRAVFGSYRQKCYCKETNDDLILLMKGQSFENL
jgi:hypothetical protein